MHIFRRFTATGNPGGAACLAALVCLLGLSDIISAQTPSASVESDVRNITGYVRDAQSGEALPHANVLIKGTYQGAATTVHGYFVIINATAAVCTLQVNYIGYETRDVVVPRVAEAAELLTVVLIPTAMRGAEVVIAAQADIMEVSKEPSQVTLSMQELATLPNIGEVDIFRSLQLLPGISGVDDGSSGLFVRGGTPDQNLVLLDGITIYHVDHFYGFFSAFNADAIKDVQVYKGGFPARYGGRTSSVIDLTGKTGDSKQVRVGVGGNLLSGNSVLEIPLSDNSTWLLSARRSYTDFIQSGLYDKLYGFLTQDQDSGVRGGATQPQLRGGGGFGGGRRLGGGGLFGNANIATVTAQPVFYFYDVNSKLTLTPTHQDIFTFSVYNGRDNLDNSQNLGGIGLRGEDTDAVGGLSISSRTRWGNTGFSGKWSRQWADRFHSDLLVAYSNYFSDYNRSSDFNQSDVSDPEVSARFLNRSTASVEVNNIRDLTLRLDNTWHLTQSHTLMAGADLSSFAADFRSVRNDTLILVDQDQQARRSAFYVQDTWQFWKSASLTVGMRGTYYELTNAVYSSPRVSFQLPVTERWSMKGAWGRYYQFVNQVTNDDVLNGSRDFWLLADTDMKPGYAEHRILGFSYDTGWYLFDVEGYYKDLDGLVEFSRRVTTLTQSGEDRFFPGTGTARGVEVLVQKKRGTFTGWTGFSLGQVTYEFPALNGGSAFPASHDRRSEWKSVGKYSRSGWSFTATWILASGQPYTVPESEYALTLLDGQSQSYIHVGAKNGSRLPTYHRLDTSISRRFRWEETKLDLGFSIFNLYNRKNVRYRQFELDTTPIVIRDVPMLSMTPTLYFKVNF